MRVIDADRLKIDFGFTWDDIAPTREEMFEIIDRQPTVDVVEVVRCNDCRFFKGDGIECHWGMFAYEDDYCSNGERREDAAKGHEG